MLLTPSNILSALRGPLAFLFIIDNPFYRTLAVILAMITDSLDGYLARRFKTTSQFGAVLDPLMDKFFVVFILGIFIHEKNLEIWEALSLISRDFAVLIFGIYLILKKQWKHFQFTSIWAGKITTTLQFFVLLSLIFHIPLPTYVFFAFILLGCLAFVELITRSLRTTGY
jgi:CDP-diacylglycerol--glycerol-3-phosphate 3-phosphatidyltransferase